MWLGGSHHFSVRTMFMVFSSPDFPGLLQFTIRVHDNLQKDISSLETLAQIALVYITIQVFPGSQIPIRIPTLSDNTTAEAVSNKLFSTQMPIALFLEKLSLLISSSNVEVDVSHIPGHDNDYADSLSRWNGEGDPPHHFLLHDRFSLTLPQLWQLEQHPKLFPSDVQIPWELPRQHPSLFRTCTVCELLHPVLFHCWIIPLS